MSLWWQRNGNNNYKDFWDWFAACLWLPLREYLRRAGGLKDFNFRIKTQVKNQKVFADPKKQNKKQKPPGSGKAHETVHQGQSLVECRDAKSFKCASSHAKVSRLLYRNGTLRLGMGTFGQTQMKLRSLTSQFSLKFGEYWKT